jgi:SAM-dependent methyltransferase/GR25 family glycosyltransferase involved in LPS biosynthesis
VFRKLRRSIRRALKGTKKRSAAKPALSQPYSSDFYAAQQAGSRRSAQAILPIALAVIKPRSAIDVGCGAGTWAAELLTAGVDAIGVDGAHVRFDVLQIPRERFRPVNLENPPSADQIGRFDLAICLEVAEHLTAATADGLVDFLTDLAPSVLFGAAIPGQGGTDHINERWQSYWIEKFQARGFVCHDLIRPAVWDREDVEPWYAQNTFLFMRDPNPPEIRFPVDIVHPRIFQKYRKPLPPRPSRPTPNSVFDRIEVINLDRRKDRLRAVEMGLGVLGVRFTRRPAVDGQLPEIQSEHQKFLSGNPDNPITVGAYAYLQTYRQVIVDFIATGKERLLVLDDDCIFHRDFASLFAAAFRQLPADWKIVHLGTMQFGWKKTAPYSSNLYRPNGEIVASHAVAYHRSVLPELLSTIDRMPAPFDVGALRSICSKHNKTTFVITPNLAIQHGSESDIRSSEIAWTQRPELHRWTMADYILEEDLA